jgi:hypothetical protein
MYRKSDIFAGNQSGELLPATRTRPATAQISRPTATSVDLNESFYGRPQPNEVGIAAMSLQQRPSTAGPSLGRPPSSAALYGRPRVEMPVKLPRYVETDKQVARFWGHFYQTRPWERQGPLGDSRIEEEVCRKFVFYYYIVDGTIEIFEPRNINSGMPQGAFFRRAKLINDETKTDVELTDLAPGNILPILGREFTMTDADTFTRDYFQ